MEECCETLERKNLEDSEECILNIVACFTNVLYYDLPTFQIFPVGQATMLRTKMVKLISPYIFESENEEIQIESMRVLCNLSRHPDIAEIFLEDSTLLEAISLLLSHSIADLVYYNVGLIMNLSLIPKGRKLMAKLCLPKLSQVL